MRLELGGLLAKGLQVGDPIGTGSSGNQVMVPDPSANKSANSGPQSDAPIKEVKDERPAQ
jgi:hypothetical protein